MPSALALLMEQVGVQLSSTSPLPSFKMRVWVCEGCIVRQRQQHSLSLPLICWAGWSWKLTGGREGGYPEGVVGQAKPWHLSPQWQKAPHNWGLCVCDESPQLEEQLKLLLLLRLSCLSAGCCCSSPLWSPLLKGAQLLRPS